MAWEQVPATYKGWKLEKFSFWDQSVGARQYTLEATKGTKRMNNMSTNEMSCAKTMKLAIDCAEGKPIPKKGIEAYNNYVANMVRDADKG